MGISLAGVADVHVVIGPPCAGKSTFVAEHARPGDVVVDFDKLANVFSGKEPGNHEHEQHIKTITSAARKAAVEKATTMEVKVWIIHSVPQPSTLRAYRSQGATIHTVDPGKEVVMSRCKRQRPKVMMVVAAKWYALYAGKSVSKVVAKTTTQKGLGWNHQQDREKLLAVHVDGKPCWWCARPMYRDAARNFDGRALAADHTHARAKGGKRADRLLHGTCNSARGDGSHDDDRPAVAAPATAADVPVGVPAGDPPGPSAYFPPAEYQPAPVFAWPSL